ncbi:amidohydrolase family protein [Negadavirga shengliensis]|uniref:Amidohydrolase family protein n=1 Tax=Negadavirga shengliensis TaxID=1389218 RepID=A0ABV9T912_9BACT
MIISNRENYFIEEYEELEKYDMHMHYNISNSFFLKASIAENFKLLSINVDVGDAFPSLENQRDMVIGLMNDIPETLFFSTSFSMQGHRKSGWTDRVIDYIRDSKEKGAVAVKVWKNIGMDCRDEKGRFMMIDDPLFDPIMECIIQLDLPLIGHIGEPKNCWLPLEEMTVSGDYEYFKAHPEFHMHLHPEFPTYEELIASRDRLLEKFPSLRFIGAHLGSMEWSVDEIAKRLDKYPHMAVDLAERISHLQLQAARDWKKVRDFICKYQDRIIYGTDMVIEQDLGENKMLEKAREIRSRHWKFFVSDEKMSSPKIDMPFQGLQLPKGVVNKIYWDNAKRWYPDIR